MATNESSMRAGELSIERSPQPMFIHNRVTLQLLRVNEAALRLYGYTRAEFSSLKLSDLRPSGEIPSWLQDPDLTADFMHYRGVRQHCKKSGEFIEVDVFSQDIIYDAVEARVSVIIDITERKRALAELSKREAEFSALVENSPNIISRLDRDLRHLYVNRAVTAATGLPPEYFIGKTNRELGMPANLMSLWENASRRAFETGEQQEIEFEFGRPNTIPRYFQARIVPERGPQGHIATVLGIAYDITAHKRAEDELLAQKQLLDVIIDNLPVGVAIKDAKTLRYIRRNRFGNALHGHESHEVNGKTAHEIFAPEHALAYEASDRRALEQRGIIEVEEQRILTKTGEVRFAFLRKVPLLDERGEPRLLLNIFDDITERKRTADALRESEARFRMLADNIRDVFWIRTQVPPTTVYTSPAYEEIWGTSREELYRDPDAWRRYVHPEDRAATLEALVVAGDSEECMIEYRIVRPDGDVRWIWDRSYPIVLTEGERGLRCGIWEDITERKRLEAERLAREVELRETLVKEVHHRIKNHLQGIAGLLRSKAMTAPSLTPVIASAIAELQSIAAVFGLRAATGNENAELRSLLLPIIAAVEGATGGRVRFDDETRTEEKICVAENEQVALALVLNELIFNSLKHNGGDPAVSAVKLRRTRGACEISVTNPSRLAPGFDFSGGRRTGSGLALVRSLLPPKAARLEFTQHEDSVHAALTLVPPLIVISENECALATV